MNDTKVSAGGFRNWLLQGVRTTDASVASGHERHHQHRWWQVMCLTGVDYFSTLGYQPGIAFIAAGVLSPIATLFLVLLTLVGALPIYSRVAAESPHGQGSIAMLERLLSRWKGKLFVLALLGFVATDFVITITLSAADATEHIIHNPFIEVSFPGLDHPVAVTLGLITILALVFLKGFKEAIGIAVFLVFVYLFLNLIVVFMGLYQIALNPVVLENWKNAVFAVPTSNLLGLPVLVLIIGRSLLVFPKLALGLSGFETGVAVMPLIENPNRIQKTRRMLRTAAIIMATSPVIPSRIAPRIRFLFTSILLIDLESITDRYKNVI